MTNHIPYDLYNLSWHSLAYHSLARFKQIVRHDDTIPADVIEQIEDNIIPALEYLEGWEPTDDMIQAHIDSHGMI
jgi:hypothetical protein